MWRLLALLSIATGQPTNPLFLTVTPTGGYALHTSGWTLTGTPVRALISGTWLNSSDGSLVLSHPPSTLPGADAWGAYNATTLTWCASTSPSTPLVTTTFLLYLSAPIVSFRATLPGGLGPRAAGDPPPSAPDSDGLSLEFPSFAMDGGGAALGFMQWSGTMLNNKNDVGPNAGPWTVGTPVAPGLASGPVVLFDPVGANSLVLSPASNFMGVSAAASVGGGALAWGPLGSFDGIPPGWGYDCMAHFGPTINANVMAWGKALLDKFGKPKGLSKSDFTNTHLGYNTDNGAYYYYSTGAYANYSVALSAVHQYAQSQGIPYRHVLLDSWWYYKDFPKQGVINWTAQSGPGWFTGGNAGIRALVEETGWKVIAHNRYWSPNTTYARQNGGDWDFFLDAPGGGGDHMAVPLEQAFWEWLLTSSAAQFGLSVYEQDWLHNEMEGVSALLTNATLGRSWLVQMGAGAQAAGVSVQLCMAFPRHALASLEMPTATQVRASDDHMVGVDSWSQWDLGLSGMLAWALGLAPFKDNFLSTPTQPGGTRNGTEVTPSLHGAASALSAGPVTPGDGVGWSDAAQILRTCDAGGRLLQPSRALTAIDGVVVRRAAVAAAVAEVGAGAAGEAGGVAGEEGASAFSAAAAAAVRQASPPPPAKAVVSATYTLLPGGWMWDHVLCANLSGPNPWLLTPQALAPTRGDAAASAGGEAPPPAVLAYSLNTTTLNPASLVILPFSPTQPLPLAPNALEDFALWHTAPDFGNGWSLLGELGKWVPVSEARFGGVVVEGGGVTVGLRGQAGETVEVTWVRGGGGGGVVSSHCVLDAAGLASAWVDSSGGAGC